MVEQGTHKPLVVGSIPALATFLFKEQVPHSQASASTVFMIGSSEEMGFQV